MSTLDAALDRVESEFDRIPEIEIVEGREVYDKQGRLVAIFDDSRHADEFVSLMVGLPDVFERVPWVMQEIDEAQKVLSDLRDRIVEQDGVISGLRKTVEDQRQALAVGT